jgi:site-specific recombinase XerC
VRPSPLSLDQLHERLWTACRRAGLRNIRWHDLRHSFGSQLAAAGVPLRQVQEWMGHSTITMTMRYMHLASGGGRELIGVLDNCRAKPVQNEWPKAASSQNSLGKRATPAGFEPAFMP